VLPEAFAVIVAEPAAVPTLAAGTVIVMLVPDALLEVETVATAVLLLLHVTFVLLAFDGLTVA
jgi:hypothetical protein